MKRSNNRGLIERTKRLTKLYYLKILRINDPPEKIALGAGIGAFIGFMPTVGTAMLFSVLFAHLFKANKAAAILGTFVMNPISSPIVWSASAALGSLIFWNDMASFMHIGTDFGQLKETIGKDLLAFFTGNFILSAIGGVVVYNMVLKGVIRRREKKAAKKFKKRVIHQSETKTQ